MNLQLAWFALIGLILGFAIGDFLYMKTAYWEDLTHFLDKRDANIINKLSNDRQREHGLQRSRRQ